MRPANLQNEDGGVQPTYARDTDEDGGGEDNVEAHSTAGFTSTRKCGLLPARCHDRQAFLSDLGRSPCQRETSPLLSERRPGHSHALCVLLVIPPSTSAIPHSKTALIIWRGSTDRYCIVRGVKCPISNLGGFTVPNSIVRGVIWTSFQAKVIQILNSGNSNKLQISSIQGKGTKCKPFQILKLRLLRRLFYSR
jgi:hypothetical protein